MMIKMWEVGHTCLSPFIQNITTLSDYYETISDVDLHILCR